MTERGTPWRIVIDTATDSDEPGELRLSDEQVSRSAVDDFAIGEWFHLEAMSRGSWFLRVGDRCEMVTVRRGKVKRITDESA